MKLLALSLLALALGLSACSTDETTVEEPAVTMPEPAASMPTEEDDENEVNRIEAPPEVVAEAFAAAYPAASGVTWDEEDGAYEASFDERGTETSVVYAADGTLQDTESEIAVADLPAAVRATLDRDYAGQEVTEAARITASGGAVTYEAEVTRDGRSEDVIFDEAGTVVSAEQD